MVATTISTDRITFWNDFLLKSQFSALSSSFGVMKQQQQARQHSDEKLEGQQEERSAFDRLPDEILIHILSQSIIDLYTLTQVLDVSQRMCQLSLFVLTQYRLPALKMAISLDQEGRNRITSKFCFDQLDCANLSIAMKCIAKTPRRYYSNKASPIIRSITAKDNYLQGSPSHNHGSLSSTTTCISLQDQFSAGDDTDNVSFNSKEGSITASSSATTTAEQQHQIKEEVMLVLPSHSITAIAEENSNKRLINRKIHTKKEGLHALQIPHSPLSLRNKRSQVSWKFEYEVSKQQERHEYHLLPLKITIELDQLLLLVEGREERKDQQQEKSQQDSRKWGFNMMGWAMNQCNI